MPPMQHLIRTYIQPMSDGMIEWIIETRKRPGRFSYAVKAIEDCNPDLICLVTLRQCLNCFSRQMSLQHISQKVGGLVEMELKLQAFERQQPQLYKKLEEELQTSPFAKDLEMPGYKQNYWRSRAKKHRVIWDEWTVQKRCLVGMALIDLLIRYTGICQIGTMLKSRNGKSPLKTLEPTPAFEKWVMENHRYCECLHPPALPMICEPVPYTTPRDGGYKLKTNRRLMLSRFRNGPEITIETAPKVFKAVNGVGATAFQVDTRVLDVCYAYWDRQGFIPGAVSKTNVPLPDRPTDESDKAAMAEYRAKGIDVRLQNIAARGQRFEVIATLSIANRFRDRPIWFPQRLDFRGRMYSAPAYLHPQGSDLSKGLLRFRNGIRFGERGLYWLKVHTANSFGVDKIPFGDRVKWVDRHIEEIRRVADDPYSNKLWHDADAPVQFLAACLEVAWATPDTISHLPVRMDGSCNGIQHLSALIRDPQAGALVNLVPDSQPRDIYQEVANETCRLLVGITKGQHEWTGLHSPQSQPGGSSLLAGSCSSSSPASLSASSISSSADRPQVGQDFVVDSAKIQRWATLWVQYGVDRSITKRPTMILPYGGTPRAVEKYLHEYVRERWVKEGQQHPFQQWEYKYALRFLRDVMWEAMGRVIPGPRALMAWSRAVAKAASKAGQPIPWTTPSGFRVRQAYTDATPRKVRTRMGDSVVKLTLQVETERLCGQKQAQSLAPNWIHSLDAAALHLTVCEMLDAGITDFVMVHDSFGTHAAHVDLMQDLIRKVLVEMYETEDWMQRLLDDVATIVPRETLPDVLARGTLSIPGIRESPYAFH